MSVLTKIGPSNINPNASATGNTVLVSNSTAVFWSPISQASPNNANIWTNTQTFSSNIVIGAGISANGSYGSNGQALFSNGTSVYWANIISGSAFSNTSLPPSTPKLGDEWYDTSADVLYKYVSDGVSSFWLDIGSTVATFANITLTGALSANGTVGTAGQVLTSSGTTSYWATPTVDSQNITYTVSNTSTVSSNTIQGAITELDAEKVAKAGDTMTGFLTLSANPTANLHAATKSYVDATVTSTNISSNNITFVPSGNLSSNSVAAAIVELDAEKVAKAGDTMTGFLTLSANPTANLHAATKGYVDASITTVVANGGVTANVIAFTPSGNVASNTVSGAISELDAEKVAKAGDTMTGLLTLSGAPTANLHAATKQYVDTSITNLVNSSPAALDTLNELALALGNDANFSTTVTNNIAGKVSKSGDTMTGLLTLSGAPTANLHATTKEYVDGKAYTLAGLTDTANVSSASNGQVLAYNGTKWVPFTTPTPAADTYTANSTINSNGVVTFTRNDGNTYTVDISTAAVLVGGDTMTGFLTLSADPTANLHAATKGYVDTKTYTLAGLTDTANVAAATNGQVLSYDGTKWSPFTLPPGTTDTYTTNSSIASNGIITFTRNDSNTYTVDISTAAVLVDGDTMTGLLTLSGAPTANLHAATKEYVDTKTYTLSGLTDTANVATASNGQVLTYSNSASKWIPTTLSTSGDVTGPASSTNNGIVVYSGTTGKIIDNANGFTFSGNTIAADAGKAFSSYQVITKTSAANGVSVTSSTLSWDYSYHKRTLTAATTFAFGAPTIASLANNDAWSMTIELTMNGGSVTWPASIRWPGGTAPTLTNAKTHLIMLVTSNGGTTVYGSSIRDY